MKTAAPLAAAALLLAGLAPAHGDAWLREIEVTAHPKRDDGQEDYSVRLLPARNHHVDSLHFECVYHQEFPWENLRGKRYTKIHEPVAFPYDRYDVKL
ncbi:MAG: hypothetical protein ACK2U9_00210, partial [Anaerolineae bacterium]